MDAQPALPPGIRACLFDLDGVLTRTARVHAAAWKEAFDEYLAARGAGQPPFDEVTEYDEYVDGRPRADGVRAFLASRGITLPEGSPDDARDRETVQGIANRKNEVLLRRLKEDGVQPYEGSVRFAEAAREAGLRRAVVSSSANCEDVLVAAGISDLFETRVDGVTAAREHLAGKPRPDTFLAAARELGVEPGQAAVFEDAQAGMEAGRAGRFGWVVGVDRTGQAEALRAHGADVVVKDLDELLENRVPGEPSGLVPRGTRRTAREAP
jgi:beta-phosphoglucomutase family hydrolase